jgi:hypothetical protein
MSNKGLILSWWHCWKVVGLLGYGVYYKKIRSLSVTIRNILGPESLPLSLLLGHHEVSRFVSPCTLHHDILDFHRPKVTETSDCGLKPLKI